MRATESWSVTCIMLSFLLVVSTAVERCAKDRKGLCSHPKNLGMRFGVKHHPGAFFQCTPNGGSKCLQCPHGLVFNQHIMVCDFPKPITTTTTTTTITTTPPPCKF